MKILKRILFVILVIPAVLVSAVAMIICAIYWIISGRDIFDTYVDYVFVDGLEKLKQ